MDIIPEKRYRELIMAKKEDYYSRVLVSLSDVKEGKVKTFNTADDLLKDLEVDKTE
jgi:hypothetical protein